MRIDKLRALSLKEARILLLALFMLPTIGIVLNLAGYQRTCQLLRFLSRKPRHPALDERQLDSRIELTGRCVRLAATRGPYRANCLRQSLLIWWLLRRQHSEAALCIGALKRGDAVEGHAWVMVAGEPVNEPAHVVDRYVTFLVAH